MFLRDRSQTLKGGPDVKYAAAGALVYLFIYLSIYINKFAMSICLSVCLFRYVFGRASTYGAETWHGVGFGELGGTVNFLSRPDWSKVI